MFPYSLINSPDGYYLSLSFACPSVLKGNGKPVSEQLEPLARAVSGSSFFSPDPLPSESHVAVTPKQAISWTSYLEFEPDLLSFIGSEHPVRDTLRAAALLARKAENLEEFSWEDYSEQDLNRATMLFPFYGAYTIATLENQGDQSAVEDFCRQLLEGARLTSNLLPGTTLPQFQLLSPANDRVRVLARRFVENYVLGKQLISVAPMITRLLMLAAGLAVLFFYLEAKNQNSEPDDNDVAWCFQLVESCILGHSEALAPLFEHFEMELARAFYPAKDPSFSKQE